MSVGSSRFAYCVKSFKINIDLLHLAQKMTEDFHQSSVFLQR